MMTLINSLLLLTSPHRKASIEFAIRARATAHIKPLVGDCNQLRPLR